MKQSMPESEPNNAAYRHLWSNCLTNMERNNTMVMEESKSISVGKVSGEWSVNLDASHYNVYLDTLMLIRSKAQLMERLSLLVG